MRTISVTELREDFNRLKEGIEKGLSYILIYRSRPLAEIKPIEKAEESEEEKKERIQRNIQKAKKLAGGFKLGKGLSPKEMNKLYDQSYK